MDQTAAVSAFKVRRLYSSNILASSGGDPLAISRRTVACNSNIGNEGAISPVDESDPDNSAPDNADAALTELLWSSGDSFNYTSAQHSRPQPSATTSRHGDFISMVSTISQAYQQDRYLEMRPLNDLGWTNLGRGSTFQASKSRLELEVISPINNNKIPEKVVNRIVIKKTMGRHMNESEIRSFNREIRILDHFHGARNIVRLLGVGWFYHHDLENPIPRPVPMLEEAACPLSDLVGSHNSLRPQAMFKIFYDIACGLRSLHTDGVVHGDIKVDNVLLFHDRVYEEGVQVRAYTAKLSDFGAAMFDTGTPQHRLGGTPFYLAPESGGRLLFSQWKLCDVYALGVLYVVVASGTEDMLQLDHTRLLIDSSTQADFMHAVRAQSEVDTEGSAFSANMVALGRDLFATTLRTRPEDRSLNLLLESFQTYYQVRPDDQRREPAKAPTDPGLSELMISYGKFKDTSGSIKDQIVQGLLRIVSDDTPDPRRPKALFELAVISLSRFANPKIPVSQGLRYLALAARADDDRAKAFYSRLQRSYGSAVPAESESQCIEWLCSAAISGYQVALDDLADINADLARRALTEFASAQVRLLFDEDPVGEGRPPVHSLQNSPNRWHTQEAQIHIAAASGSVDVLVQLIERRHRLLDVQNQFGDTPLLSACRYGQFESAIETLRHGANATISNQANENALHFFWRFDLAQAQKLIGRLLEAGADPESMATPSYTAEKWNLISDLPSVPLERMITHGRLDLIKLFIDRGCRASPRNGNQLRRMLLLAIRLQHAEIQEYLISHASERDGDFRHGLRPLHEVGWNYKGQRRTYLDAAVLGWVRQTGQGVDVPIEFWQACYHGESRQRKMEKTIDNMLRLDPSGEFNESLVDGAIPLALNERSHAAFEALLSTKILHTKGNDARLKCLLPLCWKNDGGQGHEEVETNQGPYKSSIIGLSFIMETRWHTQAIEQGDRTLFHILRRFGADIRLPCLLPKTGQQFNAYALVASSKHQDLWFVDEFRELNLQPSHPYSDNTRATQLWAHPLYHSLRSRSWAFSRRLINFGASPFDEVMPEANIFEMLLTQRPLTKEMLTFLFPVDDEEKDLAWCIPPALAAADGGYPVFLAIYKALQRHGSQVRDSPAACSFMARTWVALLRRFPHVQNQPVRRQGSVLGMTRVLHRDLFRREVSYMAFELSIAPSLHKTVTCRTVEKDKHRVMFSNELRAGALREIQPVHRLLVSLAMGSPLDHISLHDYCRSGLWRHLYLPSVHHPTLHSALIAVVVLGGAVAALLFAIAYVRIPHFGLTLLTRWAMVFLVGGLIWAAVCLGVLVTVYSVGGLLYVVVAVVYFVAVLVAGGAGNVPAVYFPFLDVDADGSSSSRRSTGRGTGGTDTTTTTSNPGRTDDGPGTSTADLHGGGDGSDTESLAHPVSDYQSRPGELVYGPQ